MTLGSDLPGSTNESSHQFFLDRVSFATAEQGEVVNSVDFGHEADESVATLRLEGQFGSEYLGIPADRDVVLVLSEMNENNARAMAVFDKEHHARIEGPEPFDFNFWQVVDRGVGPTVVNVGEGFSLYRVPAGETQPGHQPIIGSPSFHVDNMRLEYKA